MPVGEQGGAGIDRHLLLDVRDFDRAFGAAEPGEPGAAVRGDVGVVLQRLVIDDDRLPE
jgi:hypothetical protein